MFKCYSHIIKGCLYILGREYLVGDHHIWWSVTLKIKWANHSCNSQSSLFATSSTLFQYLYWFVHQKTDLFICRGLYNSMYLKSYRGSSFILHPQREGHMCAIYPTLTHFYRGRKASREMEVPLQGPFEESVIMQHNKNNQGVILSLPGQKSFLLMEHSKEELQHVKMGALSLTAKKHSAMKFEKWHDHW